MSTLQLENIKHPDSASNNISVDSSGQVGIGTASPTSTFHVDGTLKVEGSVGTISTDSQGLTLDLNRAGTTGVVNNNASGILTFGTATSERMRIDSAGRVTTPYQPAFQAQRNNGNIASTQYAVFESVWLNQGNHYNAANGRFTAPIDGTYLFHLHFLKRGAGFLRTGFHKNGALMGQGNSHTYTSNVDHETTSSQWITELSAGDYVQVYVEVGGGDFYGDGNCHNGFSGYLLG